MRKIYVGLVGSPGDPAREGTKVIHLHEDVLRHGLEDSIFGSIVHTESTDEEPFPESGEGHYFHFPGEPYSVYGPHGMIGWSTREGVVGTMGHTPVYTPLDTTPARLEVSGLRTMVQTLVERVQNMERLLEDTNRMMLAMSQSYYWTPEWQTKEERADADAKLGRSKQYVSVEEAIADLNK